MSAGPCAVCGEPSDDGRASCVTIDGRIAFDNDGDPTPRVRLCLACVEDHALRLGVVQRAVLGKWGERLATTREVGR